MKIAQKKSIFYLFVTNAWSLYLCLILSSCFNWDLIMTRFNIFYAQNEQIDLQFLFRNVSDKNTYLLQKNKDFILEERNPVYITTEKEFEEQLKTRRIRMGNRWDKQTWKSWNWVNQKNKIAMQK